MVPATHDTQREAPTGRLFERCRDVCPTIDRCRKQNSYKCLAFNLRRECLGDGSEILIDLDGGDLENVGLLRFIVGFENRPN